MIQFRRYLPDLTAYEYAELIACCRLRARFPGLPAIDAALADIDRVTRWSISTGTILSPAATFLTALGRLDAADAAYARAGALNPAAAKGYLHRADAAARGGDFGTALGMLLAGPV